MVISLNRGTPIWTPKYYSPYYWDPQKGTPNFGKPPYPLAGHLDVVRLFLEAGADPDQGFCAAVSGLLLRNLN